VRQWGSVDLPERFDIGRLIAGLGANGGEEPGLEVRRPDDLLFFRIRLRNLELKTNGAEPRLVRSVEGQSSVLLVDFPPQSFGEEAFWSAGWLGEPVPAPLPSARVRISGPSRVALLMPQSETELPYTLADVLKAMRTWRQSLDGNALPDPDPPPGQFDPDPNWLYHLLASDTVLETLAALSSALEASGAGSVHQPIAEAGARIADRAAGALSGSAAAEFGRAAFTAMQREIDALHERFPALRAGPAHEAGIAAVVLATASSIAGLADRASSKIDLISEIPYLPLLFSPRPPSDTATALEIPYRVILSPIEDAGWEHRDDPVEHAGRTELWHTRLRTAPGEIGPDGTSKVRALWSPDYEQTDFNAINRLPFLMSLTAQDRHDLVALMAGYAATDRDGNPYQPRSSIARRLHLSSLGALTDVEGSWEQLPDQVDLAQWRHLAALGRDGYVRTAHLGYLVPFGHDAALVTVTERRFESLGGDRSQRIAVLHQRKFIVVRRRVVDYDGAEHVHGGRGFPFSRIEILTRVSPDLFPPGQGDSALTPAPGDSIFGGLITGESAFWPMVAQPPGSSPQTVDFRFEVLATDVCGEQVAFSVPLLFVDLNANEDKAPEIRRAYNLADAPSHHTADLGGATVCFAPYDPAAQGDTRLPTAAMAFAAGELTGYHKSKPNFYPETDAAQVGVKPVQKLLAQPNAVVDVAYPEVFKDHGLDPGKNHCGLFLHLINNAHDLQFGDTAAKTDAIGGLASPAMSILGLSTMLGPVAGQPPADMTDRSAVESKLGGLIGGGFNAAAFFSGAKIIGGVDLADILNVASLAAGTTPKLVSREIPNAVEARFDWKTEVEKSDPAKLVVPKADGVRPTTLEMHGLVTSPLTNAAAATYTATAALTNFKVNLFGFIVLWFDELTFASSKGQKPDVAVGLHPGDDAVVFGGPLEFVNQLRSLIPSNGFSDPPSLSVTPSGIAASYSLNLPGIGVGIFALTNASLGAGFSLPFDASPAAVKFNFSEREHPFSLTVSMLGGGGFFALGISSHGVQEIEAALEFGAAVSIDLGVASGGVEIKAGVYFHWKQVTSNGSVELAGYVRLHGELSVVGLISASLTFNLQLAYAKENGASEVWGEATLTVEVDITLISFDVQVKCRKEFGGSAGDPRFIELIPDEPTWEQYCSAFAAEAA
jgi:hypothetical protein